MTVQYTVQLGQSQFDEEKVGDDGTIRRAIDEGVEVMRRRAPHASNKV